MLDRSLHQLRSWDAKTKSVTVTVHGLFPWVTIVRSPKIYTLLLVHSYVPYMKEVLYLFCSGVYVGLTFRYKIVVSITIITAI